MKINVSCSLSRYVSDRKQNFPQKNKKQNVIVRICCTIVIVVNQNLQMNTCNIELEEKLHKFEIQLL